MPVTTTAADQLRTLANDAATYRCALNVYVNRGTHPNDDKSARLHLSETCGQLPKTQHTWDSHMKGQFCKRCAKDAHFTAEQAHAIASEHLAAAARTVIRRYDPFQWGSLRQNHYDHVDKHLERGDHWEHISGLGPHPWREQLNGLRVDFDNEVPLNTYAGGITTLAELGATYAACSEHQLTEEQKHTICGATTSRASRFNESLLALASTGLDPGLAIRMMLYAVPRPKPDLGMLPQTFRTRRRRNETTETWLTREYDLHLQATIDDVVNGFWSYRDQILAADRELHCANISEADPAGLRVLSTLLGTETTAPTSAVSGVEAALRTLQHDVQADRVGSRGMIVATFMELVALGAACHRTRWTHAATERWSTRPETFDVKASFACRIVTIEGIDSHVASELAASQQMRHVALSLWENDNMDFADAANTAVLAMTPV